MKFKRNMGKFTNCAIECHSWLITTQYDQPYEELAVLCPSRGCGTIDCSGVFTEARLSNLMNGAPSYAHYGGVGDLIPRGQLESFCQGHRFKELGFMSTDEHA